MPPMPHPRALTTLILVMGACGAPLAAHEADGEHAIVPAGERTTLAGVDGPRENRGIAGVEVLGAIDLGEEFEGMAGRDFRARIITLEPGGVVAVHEHRSRPGYAYIIEGEVLEHRAGLAEPQLKRAGDVAIERSGVIHWWENASDQPVRALVVDIVPRE